LSAQHIIDVGQNLIRLWRVIKTQFAGDPRERRARNEIDGLLLPWAPLDCVVHEPAIQGDSDPRTRNATSGAIRIRQDADEEEGHRVVPET